MRRGIPEHIAEHIAQAPPAVQVGQAIQDLASTLAEALAAVDRGEFDAAAKTALQILHAQPAQPVALFILALQAEHQQRWQDADEYLRLALHS